MQSILKTSGGVKVKTSQGPDLNPFSMYNTTNAHYHDVKMLYPHTVPRQGQPNTGYSRGNAATVRKDRPPVPGAAVDPDTGMRRQKGFNRLLDGEPAAATRMTSTAHAAHGPSATLRSEGIAQEDLAGLTALRARSRQKVPQTGYGSNYNCSTQQIGAGARPSHQTDLQPVDGGEVGESQRAPKKRALLHHLVSAVDPLAAENGGKGPGYMSTTYRSTVGPQADQGDVNSHVAEATETLMAPDARRAVLHGTSSNRVPTLMFYPHDGWRPSTISRDSYQRPELAEGSRDWHEAAVTGDMPRRLALTSREHRTQNTRGTVTMPKAKDVDEFCARTLTPLELKRLKANDPFGYQMYQTGHAWHTTAQEHSDPRWKRDEVATTDVTDVFAANPGAYEAAAQQGTPHARLQALAGRTPSKGRKQRLGGFYNNDNEGISTLRPRTADTLPPSGAFQQSTTYRTAFVSPQGVPVAPTPGFGHLATGYPQQGGRISKALPLNDSEGSDPPHKKWARKV